MCVYKYICNKDEALTYISQSKYKSNQIHTFYLLKNLYVLIKKKKTYVSLLYHYSSVLSSLTIWIDVTPIMKVLSYKAGSSRYRNLPLVQIMMYLFIYLYDRIFIPSFLFFSRSQFYIYIYHV